jgi:hypothetical protein
VPIRKLSSPHPKILKEGLALSKCSDKMKLRFICLNTDRLKTTRKGMMMKRNWRFGGSCLNRVFSCPAKKVFASRCI